MDDAIYLNHAGTSWPKPEWVTEAVGDSMRSHPLEWPLRFDEFHSTVCQFFGVVDPSQLLLTPGCTSSLSAAIESIDLPAGSRVLTSQWEHHAVDGPLRKLEARGVLVETIHAGSGDALDLTALEKSLSKASVSLVAITAACNVTGDLLPFEQVIEMCHQHGAMVLLDAAQVVGWVDLNFETLGADVVAFGGHKALQAPWGIGGLYVADSAKLKCVSAQCEVPVKSKGAAATSFESRPGYCDVGSVDQFSLAGLAASIRRLDQTFRFDSLQRAREHAGRLREILGRDDRVTLFGASENRQRLPTIAFALDGASSAESAAGLRKHGLLVGSGLQCSPVSHRAMGTEESGLLRISIGLGQQENEISLAAERLRSYLSSTRC